MSSSAAACIRCGGSLESGFILDNTYGGRAPSLWVEGAPERSFWQGVKLRGRRQLPVTAERCRRCGTLSLRAAG